MFSRRFRYVVPFFHRRALTQSLMTSALKLKKIGRALCRRDRRHARENLSHVVFFMSEAERDLKIKRAPNDAR